MNRLLACSFAALLAWFVGTALNVPVWREFEPGDRSDMAMSAALAVWFATARRRPPISTTSGVD